MSYHNLDFVFGSFLRNEELKFDGSNFIVWYQRLRDTLISNDLLYVIQEPLGDEPGDSTSEDDADDYRNRRDISIEIQCAILYSMESELRSRFSNSNAYEMVDELKALFASQVRVMKYEYLDKFLSMKMEENTCLESHLATMHGIHGRLATDLDYWMTDEIAIDGVLSSPPPSYKDFVIGYVMQGELFTFHEFLARLRTMKVDPVAVEVIDGEGIFDIQVINVFMLNTYSSLLSI